MAHDSSERGSDKIFSFDDDSAMSEALAQAQQDYEIKWWWKYGTPAFVDLIRADLIVPKDKFGRVLDQFMGVNGSRAQVTAECFPYGVVAVDAYRVAIEMRRPGGR